MTHIVEIRCEPTDQTVARETVTGDREAEHRLGELWNNHASGLPGRGMIGTVTRAGETEPWQTIEG